MFNKSKISLAVCAAIASAVVINNSYAAEASDDAVEEIVVTGIKASLNRSIDMKKKSPLVSDSISAEDLGKFPDNNIADSLQRIPGVAIDRSGGEGRFVSIRGLGPDFSSVLINGRSAASENEERAFSFDTLASELIRTVDVFKTSNPGLKEGGLGGTINIVTARPFNFDGLHMAGSLKGMYEKIVVIRARRGPSLLVIPLTIKKLVSWVQSLIKKDPAQNLPLVTNTFPKLPKNLSSISLIRHKVGPVVTLILVMGWKKTVGEFRMFTAV
jgi:hypothetical protein